MPQLQKNSTTGQYSLGSVVMQLLIFKAHFFRRFLVQFFLGLAMSETLVALLLQLQIARVSQPRFAGRFCHDVSVITLEILTLRLNHHLYLGYRS